MGIFSIFNVDDCHNDHNLVKCVEEVLRMGLENKPETMIATLGVEPQVVTLALDALIDRGKKIKEVTVLYTEYPAIREALAVLEAEFETGYYPDLSFHTRAISTGDVAVKDFKTEDDLRALLRTFYSVIRKVRQQGCPLHLCISGGRKVMGVIAMTVAQLLFGPDDRVWYLITEGWRPGVNRHLHAVNGEQVLLVPVPLLRWKEAGTLMQTVTELDDPQEVLSWYHRLTQKEEEKRQDEFIRHWLTPAERKVARLACQGFENSSIASTLGKGVQTVANQLCNIYDKLREWLNFPDYSVDRNVLIARFSPYFTMKEPKGDL
jgi:CRISPR-associated protein Csx14